MKNQPNSNHFDGMIEEPLESLSDLEPDTPEYELKVQYEESWNEIRNLRHESVITWNEQVLIELDRWDSDNSVRRRTRLIVSTSFCFLASLGMIPFQIPFIDIEIDRKYEIHLLIILFLIQISCYFSYNFTVRQRNIRLSLSRALNGSYHENIDSQNRVYRFIESNLREMRIFYKQIPRILFKVSIILLLSRCFYVIFFSKLH
jgi:hypothetical protein